MYISNSVGTIRVVVEALVSDSTHQSSSTNMVVCIANWSRGQKLYFHYLKKKRNLLSIREKQDSYPVAHSKNDK